MIIGSCGSRVMLATADIGHIGGTLEERFLRDIRSGITGGATCDGHLYGEGFHTEQKL
jgi:hypothetical protein